MREILVEQLTPEAFYPFGTVIEANCQTAARSINAGSCLKFANLASPDCSAENGKPAIHLYRANPLPEPLLLKTFERHVLGSQMFMPLGGNPYLVAVAPKGEFNADHVRVFRSSGRQGIQYYRGTWHHFCLALESNSDFLVIDRIARSEDCEVVRLDQQSTLRAVL